MPREFISRYTHDLTSDDLGKLFTRETPEAYRFFARGINTAELEGLPWYQKAPSLRAGLLPGLHDAPVAGAPAMYGVALALFGDWPAASCSRGFGLMRVPIPIALFFVNIRVPAPLFADGTLWLLSGFLLMNLLVLLEVADRLSLKRDLEVAREIQQAMLPDGTWSGPGVEAFGLTKPANTVGGDFYDILPRPDGTVMVALGDVAGKASPAALLMALLLAMLRTLVDEELPLAGAGAASQPAGRRVTRRPRDSSPCSSPRSIPQRAACCSSTPARHRRCCAGKMAPSRRLMSGGMALGMFAGSIVRRRRSADEPGRCACCFTATASPKPKAPTAQPFDEAGLERTLALYAGAYQKSAAAELGRAIFDAVERHRRDQRLVGRPHGSRPQPSGVALFVTPGSNTCDPSRRTLPRR